MCDVGSVKGMRQIIAKSLTLPVIEKVQLSSRQGKVLLKKKSPLHGLECI